MQLFFPQLKEGQLEQVSQDHFQSGFEYLHRWRPPSPFGQHRWQWHVGSAVPSGVQAALGLLCHGGGVESSCSASCPSGLPDPPPQSCLPALQHCLSVLSYFSPKCRTLHLPLLNFTDTSESSSPACPCPPGWQHSHAVSLLLSSVLSVALLRVCSGPAPRWCLGIKQHWPQYWVALSLTFEGKCCCNSVICFLQFKINSRVTMMCKILGVIHVYSKQQTIQELNNLPYPERGVCFLHAQAQCV